MTLLNRKSSVNPQEITEETEMQQEGKWNPSRDESQSPNSDRAHYRIVQLRVPLSVISVFSCSISKRIVTGLLTEDGSG